MSIELPEALILARQLGKELPGKTVRSCLLADVEKLQRIGFVNRDLKAFDRLIGRKVESVITRGNVIRVKFDKAMNLILAPEYGGIVLYHPSEETVPKKLHLRLAFSDGSALTVRLTGMGVINALRDSELEKSYVYARDFGKVASPLDDDRFTSESFVGSLAARNIMLKAALVGKEAVVVGLGNSAFQDIAFRARIHPKKNVSELGNEKSRALFDAIGQLIRERLRLGGKEGFIDIYGKKGRYVPAMGPDIGKICRSCGTAIEKMSVGGGKACFCPRCQR